MDKGLVEEIVREVVSRYSKKSDVKTKKVLAIFMGGDRNLDKIVSAAQNISKNCAMRILMTKSAESIIGPQKISSIQAELIKNDGRQNPTEISSWPDILIIPVLTLNGLSKISNLMPDSLHSNVIIGCMERAIPIIAVRDSIWCSCYEPPAIGSALFRKVEEYITQIKGYGIKVVDGIYFEKEVKNILE